MLKITDYLCLGSAERTDDFIGLRLSAHLHIGDSFGPSYIDVLLSGVSPLALTNALGLNYLKALGATEQRNLPSGYTQVEYIESSGTQYIDTGYIANGGMAIEAKAVPGGTRGSYTFWIGSIGTSTEQPDNTRNAIGANGNSLSWQKGRVYSGAGFALSNNNPVVVYMNTIGNAFEGKANGTTINVNPSSVQQTLTGLTTTVKIGYSDYSSAARAMTIYYFKMWNNNYELIQNLIPCRRNSDNVLGMYDTVTGNFLTNQGTGTFTAGSDVTTPSPDTPMDIICNNGVVKVSRNLFDKSIFAKDSGSSLRYTSYQVPNGEYTMSSPDFPMDSSATNVFFLAGDVSSGASSVGNGVAKDKPISITVTNGYYTVAHRYQSSSNLDHPIDYKWQIEKGSTVTPYAPYSPNGIYTDGTQETVNIIGKNLFDVNNISIQETTAISADGSLVSNTAVNTCITYIPVKPNTTYTISGDILGTDSVFFRLAQYNADKTFISRSEDSTWQRSSYTFTTGANTYYIRFHYIKSASLNTYQLEQGSTATTYEPYFNGGTANAEMLLKVGDYKDNQELLTGDVTRNVGIKVLDGTEDWTYNNSAFLMNLSDRLPQKKFMFCTHFNYDGGSSTTIPNLCIGCGSTTNTIFIKYQTYNTLEQFKQYLADQYANGTPVIVVYPLATPTTETVTGQSLTASGNCTVTATGSLDNLELELSYKQGV